MKSLFLILYLFNAHLNQESALKANANNSSQHLKVVFTNHAGNYNHADSVLVVLDRYDHTGAGIVKKKFYPGADHSFSINGIPEGKYYATIRCLGVHRDVVEKVVRVIKEKDNTLRIKLDDCEEFSKAAVVIPDDQIRLSDLSIVKTR